MSYRPNINMLNLLDQIKQEIERIERRWGCHVLLSVTPQDAVLPVEIMRQIELLLAEAAANAVQHGKASRIRITVEQDSNTVRLRDRRQWLWIVRRNGHLHVRANWRLAVIGPQSICKRVAELGGALTLSTSDKGVELDIELPASRPNGTKNQ